MPRVTIAAVALVGGYSAAGAVAAETAADASDFNQTTHTGKNFCIIGRNSGVTTRAITITSIADAQQHRTGDIADTLLTGERKVWGPFELDGFRQTDGFLYFQAAHAEVMFSVIRF